MNARTMAAALAAVPVLVACGSAAKSQTPNIGSNGTSAATHPTETPHAFSGFFPLHDRELGTVRGMFIAVGGMSGATDIPQIGTVTLTDVSTGFVYRLATGPDGRFSATVWASTYKATGLTPQYVINGRQGECQAEKPLTVHIGQTAAVTVECQRK